MLIAVVVRSIVTGMGTGIKVVTRVVTVEKSTVVPGCPETVVVVVTGKELRETMVEVDIDVETEVVVRSTVVGTVVGTRFVTVEKTTEVTGCPEMVVVKVTGKELKETMVEIDNKVETRSTVVGIAKVVVVGDGITVVKTEVVVNRFVIVTGAPVSVEIVVTGNVFVDVKVRVMKSVLVVVRSLVDSRVVVVGTNLVEKEVTVLLWGCQTEGSWR